MQLSIIRQTPAVSILLMLMLVAAAFLRFANAPYVDELIAGGAALPGVWVDLFQSNYPIWGWVLSGCVVAMIAMMVGKMTSALSLYSARTTISIPLYAIVAGGIFIAPDSLSVALSAYFITQMFRHLCGVYVHGTDLNYAFMAGICAGIAPLFYAPSLTFIALLPIAIFMFGLSWREVVAMVVGTLLPIATMCYVNWLCGGEFPMPAIELFDAVVEPAGYTLWGSESVIALTMMGLLLFIAICGISTFIGDRRSASMRPRTILAFSAVTFVVACATFALPSATTGVFMLVALPISILSPVMLLRLRDGMSNLLIVILLILTILHLFIA